jgi:FkbM family methyltransferase
MKQKALKERLIKKSSKLLVKTGLCNLLNIKREGFILKFFPSHFSQVIWRSSFIHDEALVQEENFYKRYLKQGDTVVDVGANIGYFSLLCSSIVGKEGKVYSFEPHPRIYKYLVANISLNNMTNITTYNLAVGNETNEINLIQERNKDDRSYISKNISDMKVTMKRLDDMKINSTNVNLLKIDVEGFEKFVIEGASDILSKTQCVFFEASDSLFKRFGYDVYDLCSVLKDMQFDIYGIFNDQIKKFVKDSEIISSVPNLIATKSISRFLERTNYNYLK